MRTGSRIPPFDLLQRAGFGTGDFLPLYTYYVSDTRTHSFTDTTYAPAGDGFISVWVDFDAMFPKGAEIMVMGLLYVVPGADESVDVKITDTEPSPNVDIAERTGITSRGLVVLGPMPYSPPAPVGHLIYKRRTSPGVNTCYLYDPVIILGVRL